MGYQIIRLNILISIKKKSKLKFMKKTFFALPVDAVFNDKCIGLTIKKEVTKEDLVRAPRRIERRGIFGCDPRVATICHCPKVMTERGPVPRSQ